MTHLEHELDRLQNEITEMGTLVQGQLKKSIEAFTTVDKDLARQIIFQDRRVNATELKIDRDCENIMALFNPVAIDLRQVFATFKINSHFERIGDHAKGIARYALELNEPYEGKIISDLNLMNMYELVDSMITDNIRAFEEADTAEARTIFGKDLEVDEMNHKATIVIAKYIKESPDNIPPLLNLIFVSKKLERIGDLNTNIAEEIIFFVEANVLKHEKEKL
jgi:phosphate transport system protein